MEADGAAGPWLKPGPTSKRLQVKAGQVPGKQLFVILQKLLLAAVRFCLMHLVQNRQYAVVVIFATEKNILQATGNWYKNS